MFLGSISTTKESGKHKSTTRKGKREASFRKDKNKGDESEDITIQDVLKEFGKSSFQKISG